MPMQISGVTIQGGMNILPRAGAPSPSPTPGLSDPNFSNVVFMFDGDGTDGEANNTFTDSSTNGVTVTENGSVVQGSFSPYGDSWSWYTKNSAIAFTTFSTTGDYTAEAWVLVNAMDSSGRNNIFYGGNNTQLSIGSLGGIGTVLNGSSVISRNYSADTNDGSWHHVAWCRSGTTNRVFLDGNLVGSGTSSSEIRIQQISGYAHGFEHDGFISNARVTNTALYTANFTPPTEPLTAVSGTHVLTAQSNRFVDNSSNQYNLTINRGTPKVTPFSPFKNDDARDITTDGGSGYFNTNNYLTTSNVAFGTNNFTIETWVYFDDASATQNPIIVLGTDGYNDWQLDTSSSKIRFQHTSGNFSGATTLQDNSWYHVAVVREGTGTNQIKIYLNGEVDATSTVSENFDGTGGIRVGINRGSGSNYYLDGYLSDTRVVNGTAVYTSAFTPPTAPLPAVTNTELLLNFQDSAIYDYSGLNNIDTVGDAQIDTAIKKYGTGSVKFDGSGDYLIAGENLELAPGAGDFTVEFWMYGITGGNNFYNGLYQNYTNGENRTTALRINTHNADQTSLMVQTAATGLITTSSGVVTSDAWNHVALVRNGSSLVLYVNGVSAGSTTNTTNFSDGYAIIGNARYGSNDYLFAGYIDDFRITKGVARYTSNFTAPTAALPKF